MTTKDLDKTAYRRMWNRLSGWLYDECKVHLEGGGDPVYYEKALDEMKSLYEDEKGTTYDDATEAYIDALLVIVRDPTSCIDDVNWAKRQLDDFGVDCSYV